MDMIKGYTFAEDQSSKDETIRARFERVFPGNFSKTTYNRHKKIWRKLKEEPELLDRFMKAGLSDGGLWTNVTKLWPELMR